MQTKHSRKNFLQERIKALIVLSIACFSVFAISEASDKLQLYKLAQTYQSKKVFLERIETIQYGRIEFQKIAIFHIYDPQMNRRIIIKDLRPTDLFFDRAIYDKQKYRANSTIQILANKDNSHYYIELGNSKRLWIIIAIAALFWVFVAFRLAIAIMAKD